VLPDSAKEKPQRGKVIAVGEGKMLDDGKRAPVSVKKDQQVLFTSYAALRSDRRQRVYDHGRIGHYGDHRVGVRSFWQ
jgi:co-chaperonin GroES (HSP10)